MKQYLVIALIGVALLSVFLTQKQEVKNNLRESCNNYDGENSCQGGTQTDNPEDWANRNFQTPPRGDKLWKYE